MSKKKLGRIVGFAVAAGATATMVGFAASSTGAYFTDVHNGSVKASLGNVKVNTSDLSLNFTSLLPGEFQTKTINYTGAGTGAEDIWLVLPSDGSAAAFNGTGGSDAALGRYGHFAVSSPAGSFTSYNLASPGSGIHSGDSCGVDANGHGGSNDQAADKTTLVNFCPVPNAILLSSNLSYGESASADVTYGWTKLLKGPNLDGGTPLAPIASFRIVATQHGVTPTDVNNNPIG
ncbi:hypothetical protein M6D93_01875 [Jatrophihabitans telluris]|uniref:Ribosomally synthesized peptide with SipW-like signal peptide n=1 Tax=Jatrophihabitans telluris TaxID=2038343 RepID=A0ABY4R0H2_9ACTN|nr:hypothetical protein [Jatrophihabitans telluris]UQX88761.1 hypothetical protein M6D93_01875 [Jatrophihabitans telluris]